MRSVPILFGRHGAGRYGRRAARGATVALVAVLLLCGSFASAQIERMQSRVVSELIHKTVVKLVVPSSGSLGSGTIISPDGHILTNMHVVSPHGEAVGPIEVYVMPGVIGSAELSYVAEFVRGDAELDLAVVKIVSDPEGREITDSFLHLKIGDVEAMDLAPPHQVWAWGFPSGSGATITAFHGIVSGYLGEIPVGLFHNVEARPAADGFEPMRYAEILV